MSMRSFLLLAFLLVAAGYGYAQDKTNIVWGDPNFTTGNYYLLGDSNENLYVSDAMIAIGYFQSGFNVNSNAQDTQALYDSFTVLATSLIGENINGYATGSVTVNAPEGADVVNKTIYYFVLKGATTYDEASVVGVSEYAILSDSSWGTVPQGTSPSAYIYDIQRVNLDTVVYGEVVNGAGQGTGNLYKTAQQVPEPGFYAAGLGIVALLVVELRRRRKTA